tara:strand:+ start:1577 stop:1792 length:216 start_codon:yes stop_codon:yes gene_type:complete
MPKIKIAVAIAGIAELMEIYDYELASRFRTEKKERLNIAQTFFRSYSDNPDAADVGRLAIRTATMDAAVDD